MNSPESVKPKPEALSFLVGLLLLALLFNSNTLLFSQTPPKGASVGAEEEAFRKPKREIKAEAKPLIDYEVEELPPGAIVETSFFVKEIVVEGETNLSPAEVEKILSRYENQELTLVQLKEVARALTVAIRSRGYVTSRVYLPPQKIQNGVVQFKVLEGKLGKISVRGARRFKEGLMKRLLKAKTGQILRYDRLEQDLLRLNTHPDRQVRAVLLPGELPETSDLVLDVKETFPIHVGYSFDNVGTRLTGRKRHGVSLADTNLLGLDDIFQGRFLISEGDGRFVGTAVDYFLPLTASTDFVFDYTFVESLLGGEFERFKIKGRAHIYSATLVQRLLDLEHIEGSVFAGFDFKEIGAKENKTESSTDHLRILRVGPQLVERDRRGRTFLSNEFAFGFGNDFLGASDDVDIHSSRKGAGGEFFRSVLELGRFHQLPWGLFLLLRTALHLTPDKLPASEQMRVGGAETVRGYLEGDFLGERGLNTSTELRFPCYLIPKDSKYPRTDISIRDSLQFLGFVDFARVETKGAAENQDTNRTLVGVGGGLRFSLNRKLLGRNATARVDWGYPVGAHPVSGKRVPRLYFSLNITL